MKPGLHSWQAAFRRFRRARNVRPQDREQFMAFVERQDTEKALHLLDGTDGLEAVNIDKVKMLASAEWKVLADLAGTITEFHEVAIVGCGACPESVLIARSVLPSSISVTGIEHDPRAACLAHLTCDRLRLANVQIIEADGETADWSRYEVVVVTNYVRPKAEVCRQLSMSKQKPAWCIVRNPILFMKRAYEYATPMRSRMHCMAQLVNHDWYLESAFWKRKEGVDRKRYAPG